MPDPPQFNTDRTYLGQWTITFSNPPINMFVPTTIVELGALMTNLETDPSVKVVVFQSANPDFFTAHLDVAKAVERPEVLGLWRDFVLRLSSAPVVSIAKIRGRTRGIGNEFVLACDMRFASRQSAPFGNPEVGVGLIPGGGALEWLPRLVGRSRALEFVLSGNDFDADIAERYGWVNRTLDDDDLDSFVDTLARRLASFDRETLAAAKAQLNRFGTPFCLQTNDGRSSDPSRCCITLVSTNRTAYNHAPAIGQQSAVSTSQHLADLLMRLQNSCKSMQILAHHFGMQIAFLRGSERTVRSVDTCAQ